MNQKKSVSASWASGYVTDVGEGYSIEVGDRVKFRDARGRPGTGAPGTVVSFSPTELFDDPN